jgi:hypothetical protein
MKISTVSPKPSEEIASISTESTHEDEKKDENEFENILLSWNFNKDYPLLAVVSPTNKFKPN